MKDNLIAFFLLKTACGFVGSLFLLEIFFLLRSSSFSLHVTVPDTVRRGSYARLFGI